MSMILKLIATLILGVIAFNALTTEVLNPPPGKSLEEFSHEMASQRRNVVVLRHDADPVAARKGVTTSGTTYTALSFAFIFWAFYGWLKRKRA